MSLRRVALIAVVLGLLAAVVWVVRGKKWELLRKPPASVAPQAPAIKPRSAAEIIPQLKDPPKRVGVTIKACTQGANEGGAYLFSPGGTYRGKVTPRGTLQGPSDLAEGLAPISADPVAAALAYGQETGECACCGRELSDPVSVYGGIGPICLERLAGRDARKQLEAQFKASQAGSLQLVVA
jgi:hypothetical protein